MQRRAAGKPRLVPPPRSGHVVGLGRGHAAALGSFGRFRRSAPFSHVRRRFAGRGADGGAAGAAVHRLVAPSRSDRGGTQRSCWRAGRRRRPDRHSIPADPLSLAQGRDDRRRPWRPRRFGVQVAPARGRARQPAKRRRAFHPRPRRSSRPDARPPAGRGRRPAALAPSSRRRPDRARPPRRRRGTRHADWRRSEAARRRSRP